MTSRQAGAFPVQRPAAFRHQLLLGSSDRQARRLGREGRRQLGDLWITQFQSGLPIRLQTQDDNELISSLFFIGTGAAEMTGTKMAVLNPKKSDTHLYLDPTQFNDPALGTFATTPRSAFRCGRVRISGICRYRSGCRFRNRNTSSFRTDIFNVFNKTQFFTPDGNFSNSTFGQVLQARDPRAIQFALKFYF